MIPSVVHALASSAGALATTAALLSWALMRTAIWPPSVRLRTLAATVSAVSIGAAVYAGAGAITAILNA
jgi:hypothetical protein